MNNIVDQQTATKAMPPLTHMVPREELTCPEGVAPEVYQKVIQLNSEGARLHGEGNIQGAYVHYLAAYSLDNTNALVLQNLAAALLVFEKFDAAATMSRKALQYDPDNIYVKCNYGVALMGQRLFKESRDILKEVLRSMTEAGPLWHNLGLAYYMLANFERALSCLDKSLELNPGVPQVMSDRGISLLSLGKIQQGLAQYEVRWHILFKNLVWKLNLSEWKGEPLMGKHLLVHHEQGFGDTLMLCRFLHNLKAKGAKLTLAVPAELVLLMKSSFDFVNVISWDTLGDASEYDFHSPLLSVMRWLGLESPKEISSASYISTPETYQNLPEAKYKIGICWASGDHGPVLTRRRRVIDFKLFLPLFERNDVAFVSLQKGANENDIEATGALCLIQNHMARIENFQDTAEIVNGLDLIISVDSSMAHLAGAMGKPVIMLGPAPRCWRWWGVTSGAPWYDNFTIVPQDEDGSWKEPVKTVIRKVTSWIKAQEAQANA